MSLTENTYEQKLLLDLPPKARDEALRLFSNTDLGDLLLMIHDPKPDTSQLTDQGVPASYWIPVLKAAILAKITYFLPRGHFNKAEILYLLKIVCLCIDYPSSKITFIGVIEEVKDDMPVLQEWLTQLSKLLITPNN